MTAPQENGRHATWRVITWSLAATTCGWFIGAGFRTLRLAQQAADEWIGEPHSIPFIPYFSTDDIVTPIAPFYALFVQGNWEPIVWMCALGWGLISLSWLTKRSARKAYPQP